MPIRYPRATYRIQVNPVFRLEHVRAILPWLEKLGISDLYLSPIFCARPGSMHGYDVTDPSGINPEIGGAAQLRQLCSALRARDMGLIIDIVPNHMATTSENLWWMDVLENGSSSPFGGFFDVEWGHVGQVADMPKIFLPILGDPFGTVLENRQFELALDERGFCMRYYSSRYPVDPSSYGKILEGAPPVLSELLELIGRLPANDTPAWEGIEARRRDVPSIKENLQSLYNDSPEAKRWIDARLRDCNADVDWMELLLQEQVYRLAWWQGARERINYRRFFDVSDLIALRQENPEVFAATHGAICELVRSGCVTGVRVDHVDGLFNPREYLERLISDCGQRPYVAVEKILLGEERLPADWNIEGTTGYDFLGMVNNLYIDAANLPALQETYSRFTGLKWIFDDAAYEQKRWIARHLFRGEMFALGLHLGLLAELDRHARDISPKELRLGLSETTVCLPVYRTYIETETVCERDRRCIQGAIARARRRNPDMSPAVFDFLERVFLLQFPASLTAEQRSNWLRFVMRWQQLTGPITAKGVEDTAYYLYNRLISMNEVGGHPEAVSVEQFHAFNQVRWEHWPKTMNASSTHDTKRSEDVRARLQVLSEMPVEWSRALQRWARWNRDKKPEANAPDSNEEILLYQTMLGAWPLDDNQVPAFVDRLKQYVVKAAREAKVYSSWIKPDERHEQAIHQFIDAILGDQHFLEHFRKFQSELAWYGALNSLSQVLLKITSPGAPDFYQGSELWDFSMVDPDNRRPIDLEARLRLIDEMDQWNARDLLEQWTDGRIKAFVSARALRYRVDGDYIPVPVNTEHAVAFARRAGDRWTLTVAPRFVSRLAGAGRLPIGRRAWKDSALEPPAGFPATWRNVFTGEPVRNTGLANILHSFPIAMLYHEGTPS